MFGSSERQPLKGPTDEKARRALSDLSHSLGDEESSFLSRSSPGQPASTGGKLWKEVRQNWWLWGSIAFAVLLIGSLVVFRDSLYDTAAHGLPFLAVKENAAEACATQCKEEQSTAQLAVAGSAGDQGSPVREAYDTCYTKCVAQETKEVAEEREKFKQSEETFEKMVEEKEGIDSKGASTGAKKTP